MCECGYCSKLYLLYFRYLNTFILETYRDKWYKTQPEKLNIQRRQLQIGFSAVKEEWYAYDISPGSGIYCESIMYVRTRLFCVCDYDGDVRNVFTTYKSWNIFIWGI